MSVTYRSLSKYFAFSVFSSYPWGCLQSLHLRQFKHIFLIFPQLRPMHCNAVSVWKFATGNESFLEITVYFCDNRFLRQQIAISYVSIYMYFNMTCTKKDQILQILCQHYKKPGKFSNLIIEIFKQRENNLYCGVFNYENMRKQCSKAYRLKELEREFRMYHVGLKKVFLGNHSNSK